MTTHARKIALLAALLLGLPALQACIPLIATGVGTGIVATLERRSYGAQVEDSEIELRNLRDIRARYGDSVRTSTTSFNRWVLLSGAVPTEAIKADIEQITRRQPGVRHVVNDLYVGSVAGSFGSYTNDMATSTKVRARLIESRDVSAKNIKVVTEIGTVYLLGLVTQRESAAAIQIARSTSGVRKVIEAFEVISDEEARRLDPRPPVEQSAPAAGS